MDPFPVPRPPGAGQQIDLTGRPTPETGQSPLQRLVVRSMYEQGLTLDDVAVRGGLALATVAALRSGERGKRPRRETLERLAVGLALPVEEVLRTVVPAQDDALERAVLHYFRRLSEDDKDLVIADMARLAAAASAQPFG